MLSLHNIMVILFAHWIADFVFQPDEIAKNKSKDIIALLTHIFIYSAVTLGIFLIMFHTIPFGMVCAFTILNSLLHFLTDYITAPIVSNCFKIQDHHNAFVVIGFDQLVHLLCLFTTAMILFN